MDRLAVSVVVGDGGSEVRLAVVYVIFYCRTGAKLTARIP